MPSSDRLDAVGSLVPESINFYMAFLQNCYTDVYVGRTRRKGSQEVLKRGLLSVSLNPGVICNASRWAVKWLLAVVPTTEKEMREGLAAGF